MRVLLPEILIKIYMDLKGTDYENTQELLDNFWYVYVYFEIQVSLLDELIIDYCLKIVN